MAGLSEIVFADSYFKKRFRSDLSIISHALGVEFIKGGFYYEGTSFRETYVR